MTEDKPQFTMVPEVVRLAVIPLRNAAGTRNVGRDALALYVALRGRTRADRRYCWPSRQTLADELDYTKARSVDPLIAALESVGVITVRKCWTDGTPGTRGDGRAVEVSYEKSETFNEPTSSEYTVHDHPTDMKVIEPLNPTDTKVNPVGSAPQGTTPSAPQGTRGSAPQGTRSISTLNTSKGSTSTLSQNIPDNLRDDHDEAHSPNATARITETGAQSLGGPRTLEVIAETGPRNLAEEYQLSLNGYQPTGDGKRYHKPAPKILPRSSEDAWDKYTATVTQPI